MEELPKRESCIHHAVCKFDDAVCPMECGHFEDTRPTPEAINNVKHWSYALTEEQRIEEYNKGMGTPEAIKDKLGFNPEWDMLEASQESLLEHMRELNRLHDLTKDIEWVEECDNRNCGEDGMIYNNLQNYYEPCPKCKGKKTITRQATMGEVVEAITMAIGVAGIKFKVNNGTLRIKENL